MAAHRAIAVLGTKGAPGATTVAIRLATDLATHGGGAALVDLDPEGGDVVAYLGLDPKRNLFTLAHLTASRGMRIEDLRAEGHDAGDRVFALTGLPRREMSEDIPPSFVADLVEILLGSFAFVVCDVGRNTAVPLVSPILDRAALVLLVARADLVGIWNAERTLAALSPELRDRTSLVVCRMRRAESAREVAAALGRPLAGVVPFDAVEARRATFEQRPMRGRCVRALKRVARELAADESPPTGEPQRSASVEAVA